MQICDIFSVSDRTQQCTETQLIQQHSLKCHCEILSQDVTPKQLFAISTKDAVTVP